MSSYILKNDHLKVNNLKYYRSNGIQLGDVGTKRTSVFSINRVDSQSSIPKPKMKVKCGGAITMNSIFANSIASFFTLGPLSGAGLKAQLTAGRLKVARYYMEDPNMKDAIQNSPKLIDAIRNIGRDTRVVSDVWVVASADIIEATVSKGVLGIFGSGGGASGASVSLSGASISIEPGAVLAYMLHKINWNEKQKKNWSTIKYMTEDPKGL